MKTILSSRKHHYVARVCIFLITVALIAGMAGCAPITTPTYNLTMVASPTVGGTATDLTNASPYTSGTVVNIQAQPATGYQFANWTAPAGTFANPNAATTTFIMPGQAVTVTANFQQQPQQPRPLDHFKCYWTDDPDPTLTLDYMHFEDQFGAVEASPSGPVLFCNPVEKEHDGVLTQISDPDHHLTFYDLYYEEWPQMWFVEVDNQFGTQNLTVYGPVMLAVPTQKVEPGDHEPPEGLDHFLLYKVIAGPDMDVVVGLNDQFGDQPEVVVTAPAYFANPVQKTDDEGIVTEIQNPDAHLVFYWIEGDEVNYPNVQVVNQFGGWTFDVFYPALLAVPSEKINFDAFEPEPVALDHFECYWTEGSQFIGEPPGVVYLEDQFGAVEAMLGENWYFCNPVEKWHDEVLTPIFDPDHHLTLYDITCNTTQTWLVEVDNQFGTQNLTVYGPVMLAVPTQKVEPWYHEPPVGLDHFLLYEVITGPQVNVVVGLNDQFSYEEVLVTAPAYFANPVQKTVAGDIITPIGNLEAHLVFYDLSGEVYPYPHVQAVNQFGEWTFLEMYGPYLLAVPSEKLSATPVD